MNLRNTIFSGSKEDLPVTTILLKKRFLSLVLASVMFVVPSVLFSPDIITANSGESTALLNLEAHIGVQAQVQSVVANFSGTGEFEVTADFHVSANIRKVAIYVEATDFHYSTEDETVSVDPIPIEESAGVTVDAQGAVPLGSDNNLSYAEAGEPIDGIESRKTETVIFESSEGIVFDHPVSAKVTWNQDDPLKPAGQYLAKIKLTCLVPPP